MNDFLTIIFETDLYTQVASVSLIGLSLLFIKNKLILLFTGISKKTATDFDDIILKSIQKPLTYLIILVSLILISEALNSLFEIFEFFDTSKVIYLLIVILISWTLLRILNGYYINKSFLKNLKESNSSIKALAYQLYENNGVIKREMVVEYLKKLGQDERKILRDLGVKFGRYHIFLFRLLKPEAVSLRTLLWKNFNQKSFDLTPPTFGLNFLDDKNLRDKNFMLLCGFENFGSYFVRIDILERLFVQIINSEPEKNKEIKLVPEMLNLLGCSKENFKKLIEKMNYKIFEKDKDIYFKYNPQKQIKKTFKKTISSNNPFKILKDLNLN